MSWFGGKSNDGVTAVPEAERAPQSEEFKQAYEEAPKLKNGTNEEKLRLYGLATVAKNEKTIDPSTTISSFSLSADSMKKKAWLDASKDPETDTPAKAQAKYVEFVNELKQKYA